MERKQKVVVVGLGEVGKPLFDLMSEHHETVGVDITPVEISEATDVLHVCYPFQIPDFIGETARYIALYKPTLTIINSTVGIGTTRLLSARTGTTVVNSPVRGKHAHMLDDMRKYTKIVGASDTSAGDLAARHFQSVGLKTKVLATPEASELAKLCETTYFGLLISWAQEVERYCDSIGANYDEVVSIFEEIKFLPQVKYFAGVIGGHCVMPNIELLSKFKRSMILDAIKASNLMKIEREAVPEKPVAVG